MDDIFLLKAAVTALIPIGLGIGISLFILAYRYSQSIRGSDVGEKMNRIRLVILILFAAFVGVFALIQYVLKN